MPEPARPDDTAFASSARVTLPELHAQRAAFLGAPAAVALLDAMPGPGVVLNARRQIVAANRAFSAVSGVPEGNAVLGMRFGEAARCVHAGERAAGCGTTASCAACGVVGAVLECSAQRRAVLRECRVQTLARADGGALDVRLHASPLRLGGHDLVVVGLENIADGKRRVLLERLVFGELLAGAREVRAAAARLEPGAAGEAAEGLRVIAGRSGAMVDRIEAQHALLAAERGELEVQPALLDLAAFLGHRLEAARREPVAEGRTLRFESVKHCPVESDPAILARALDGLVRNALEATPPGGTVEVTCEYDHEIATVAVHNDGVMPAEVQLQVFQRSFSTRGEEGRGVGTWAARLFAERYLGGRLAFMSEPRVGTLFVLMLPHRMERRTPLAAAA